ncbi:hypothetical protein AOLI_G00089460 [Acnodon oligacanthus]
MMADLWTRLLQLLFLRFLLHCADSTEMFDKNIHTINRTASQGETLVFHCNESENKGDEGADVGWRKEEIVLFIYSPVINQTVINYTSSRMYVDPNNPRKLQISDVQPSDGGSYTCFPSEVQKQWKLIIEVTKSEPDLQSEMFVPSVTGAAAVCLIIICVVMIHRKWKKKQATDVSGRKHEHVPVSHRLCTNILHPPPHTALLFMRKNWTKIVFVFIYMNISSNAAAKHNYRDPS